MITRKVYQFIIFSKFHDKIVESTDLYLTKEIAIEFAKKLNEEHFREMRGNYFDTKSFIVKIFDEKNLEEHLERDSEAAQI